ncbi:MAG: hypothetical protein OQK56_03925 [Ignavibacteriaceae bacterium]|jgi:hypothetical protein|nr:hypothetical protein [Ignavibacteriaceae bacterium]
MKRGHSFMSATLMCSFFIIAFKFGPGGIEWFWAGQEIVPLILGISAIIFGSFWFYDYMNSRTKTKSK